MFTGSVLVAYINLDINQSDARNRWVGERVSGDMYSRRKVQGTVLYKNFSLLFVVVARYLFRHRRAGTTTTTTNDDNNSNNSHCSVCFYIFFIFLLFCLFIANLIIVVVTCCSCCSSCNDDDDDEDNDGGQKIQA